MDVVANGVKFHVQELGGGERPGPLLGDAVPTLRTPVVMLHGLLVGTLAAWYFTAAPALAAERRVRMFDLRGHGRTERVRSGYDVATMAADLGALVEGIGQGPVDRESCEEGGGRGPVDLVGHSFGALVALRFALDHPEKVRRVVIVEAPLPPSRFDELETFAARSPAQMIDALPPDLKAFLAQGGRKAARLVESIRFLVEDTTLLASLRAEPDIPDEALARLDRPVLCVYGDRSSCREVGSRLARVIPGAKLVLLPGGHYLHLDATAPLTRAILEFFDA